MSENGELIGLYNRLRELCKDGVKTIEVVQVVTRINEICKKSREEEHYARLD